MANTITVSVQEHRGTYEVAGDMNATGDYSLIKNFQISSFSGVVPGLGKFSASKTEVSMMYRMIPDNDDVAEGLMSAALAIKAMIEAKFSPVQEPQEPGE